MDRCLSITASFHGLTRHQVAARLTQLDSQERKLYVAALLDVLYNLAQTEAISVSDKLQSQLTRHKTLIWTLLSTRTSQSKRHKLLISNPLLVLLLAKAAVQVVGPPLNGKKNTQVGVDQ